MARTIELADGVYRIATDNYRLNTGLVLGLERALVVDTGAGPRQATEIYDEVRRLTRLPITVVNTHGHYERFFGNDVFAAMGAEEFWAHPRAARAIRKYGAASLRRDARTGNGTPPGCSHQYYCSQPPGRQ